MRSPTSVQKRFQLHDTRYAQPHSSTNPARSTDRARCLPHHAIASCGLHGHLLPTAIIKVPHLSGRVSQRRAEGRLKLEKPTCDSAHFFCGSRDCCCGTSLGVRREAETHTAPGARHWTSPTGKLDRLRERGKGARLVRNPSGWSTGGNGQGSRWPWGRPSLCPSLRLVVC